MVFISATVLGYFAITFGYPAFCAVNALKKVNISVPLASIISLAILRFLYLTDMVSALQLQYQYLQQISAYSHFVSSTYSKRNKMLSLIKKLTHSTTVSGSQLALLLLANIIPKDKSLWVYGCLRGYSEGCAAIIEIAHKEGTHRNVWLYRSESERVALQQRGMSHYPLHSLRGYWYCLRANLAFIAYGFNDLNGTAIHGAKIINVWHGTPLKKIYFDSPQLLGSSVRKRVKRYLQSCFTRRIYIFPVSSEISRTRIESAFRLKPKVAVVVGEPRTDKVLLKANANHTEDLLINELLKLGPDRVLLYAPTWRAGSIQSDMQGFHDLVSLLEKHDKYVAFRAHPLDGNNPILKFNHRRVLLFPQNTYQDVNDYLWLFGALITDYSSIAIDFSLRGRSIYFFAPDIDSYHETQGLYESYDEFTDSSWHKDWHGLIQSIEKNWSNGVTQNNCSKKLLKRYHEFQDGQSALRTYELCKKLSNK
ncbi:CDP-glycerol glycerophosphotransferase family protein [Pseudomonas sp. PDM33]|uniref:CDP-glycerol glycerophosphotransferase family protein n=1 Tax=Pseudomonas sp. PDM33 TaxID=2854765 RepID=UPI001C44FDB1|nr:CDP-glycerol glycerophosphotransferase family protein [Pseudomonas sp. PDM33]MBV7582752.1 CDP-glycerol glycerophosphotransferase family protein [Pseudomonas sp. PDM33]